jgi:competence protein ComEC
MMSSIVAFEVLASKAMNALLINQRIPFFRRPLWPAAWLFGVGILVARLAPLEPWLFWGPGAVVPLAGAILRFRRNGLDRLALAALALACLMAGGWRESLEHRTLNEPDRVRVLLAGHDEETPVDIAGTLADWPEPALGRVRLVISVERFRQTVPARGRVRLTLSLDRPEQAAEWARLALAPGARLSITARLGRTGRFNNPGGPDFGNWLDSQGYDAAGEIISLVQESPGDGRALSARLGRLRLAALERLARDFSPRTAGLLAAAMLGSEHFLDATWAESFRRSGTFHLLVISGSHFALLAAALRRLLNRLLRREGPKAVALLAAAWAYAWLVGGDPPVLRAALAVTIWQMAALADRRPDWLNVIGASVLAMLAASPDHLFGASFQLTFTAVIALVGGAAPLYATLRRVGVWRPTRGTPFPPDLPRGVRRFAEALFWRERAFRLEQKSAPIRLRLDKSPLAARLESLGIGRFNLQAALRWTFGLGLATGSVQIALLPLEIYYFNRFAPLAVLSNIAAELAMTLVMFAAAAYFMAAPFGPWLRSPLARLAEAAVNVLVRTADFGAGLPFANQRIPHLEGQWVGIYLGYAVGMLLLGFFVFGWRPLARTGTTRRTRAFLGVGVAFTLMFGTFTLAPPRHGPAPGVLRVTFLDVGQGDCALVEFPDGRNILIDSGGVGWRPPSLYIKEDVPGIGERVVSRCLWARGIRRLDAVFATHPDSDHIQAFSEIAENFPIGCAWHGPIKPDDPTFATFAAALTRHGVPLRRLAAPARFDFGDVALTVIAPFEDLPMTSDNDESLVIRLDYGRRAFLFTGDIEAPAEAALLARNAPLACDVVKAPHHGSKSSSTPGFIRATGAAHVVFCAPRRSPFGHPHAEIVNRYRELLPNARRWQTGPDGAVTFETDGRCQVSGVGFQGRTNF